MISYLDDQRVNQNNAEVLFNWPASARCSYRPSPEVRVLAKRVYDASVSDLLAQGTGLSYGVEVGFDLKQVACKGIDRDGLTLKYSFSGVWFGKYTDHATVLNNCRYILDIVGQNGLMPMPAHHRDLAKSGESSRL